MARAIDKQTMLDIIIEAKRMDPETGLGKRTPCAACTCPAIY